MVCCKEIISPYTFVHYSKAQNKNPMNAETKIKIIIKSQSKSKSKSKSQSKSKAKSQFDLPHVLSRE